MSDTSSQIRDYIDGLTHRVIDDGPRMARRRKRGGGLRRLTWLAVPLAVVMIFVLATRTRSDRTLVAVGPSPFVPPAKTVLPLVFPDGSSVDLVYPRSADLGKLGFSPSAAIGYSPYESSEDRPDRVSPHPCCGRTLTIRNGTIREVMGERAPTKVYTGARSQAVPFFDSTAVGAGPADLPELAFQFGSWTVLAYDYPAGDPRGTRMTDEQRAVFASRLDGYEDDRGFLVLEPSRPLCFTDSDGPGGVLGDLQTGEAVGISLQPKPYPSDIAITSKGARGYKFLNTSTSVTLILPDNSFALTLLNDLRSLQDEIEIANLRRETRRRC